MTTNKCKDLDFNLLINRQERKIEGRGKYAKGKDGNREEGKGK